MSLLIAAYNADGATVCSEDRAGITDAVGNFIPTVGGRIKSVHVTPNIIFGVVGRNSAADVMKSFVKEFAAFSFDRLTVMIPTVARSLVDLAGSGAGLEMILTGWDSDANKMRAVYWSLWDSEKDYTMVEYPVKPGHTNLLILGSSQEGLDTAQRLWLQSSKIVPDCFSSVFSQMADLFPHIGRVLTTNTVTRSGVKLASTNEIISDANFKKTTPAQIQFIDPNTGQATASTIMNAQLSFMPGQSVAFTKAAETTTTLGLSWGTQTLTLSDSSTILLTGSSISFTGLTPGTTYYSYMYITVAAGVCTMHAIQVTSPSSATAMQTALDGRYPIGIVQDTTTTSGTGLGGDIDPGGTCPHEDAPVYIRQNGVESIISAKDVRDGDEIKGYSFALCADVYRKVSSIRHCESTMWFRVRGHLCSPCEQVYVDGAWYPAWRAPNAERVRGLAGNRIEISVVADGHAEKNYYLAGDVPLLIHNMLLTRS